MHKQVSQHFLSGPPMRFHKSSNPPQDGVQSHKTILTISLVLPSCVSLLLYNSHWASIPPISRHRLYSQPDISPPWFSLTDVNSQILTDPPISGHRLEGSAMQCPNINLMVYSILSCGHRPNLNQSNPRDGVTGRYIILRLNFSLNFSLKRFAVPGPLCRIIACYHQISSQLGKYYGMKSTYIWSFGSYAKVYVCMYL